MPNFNRGDVIILSLDSDDSITFTGVASFTVSPSGGTTQYGNVTGTNQTLGPFGSSVKITFYCDTSGSYTQNNNPKSVLNQAQQANSSIKGIPGVSNGRIYGEDGNQIEFVDTYSIPDTPLTITASQCIVGKSCKLKSIACVAGTSIVLTVYDNITAGSGDVLFTRTMSADDSENFNNGIKAINGLFVTLSGASTFKIGVQDAI